MLTWLFPVPYQRSQSCLLTKLISNSFLGEGSLFCVHEDVWWYKCSNWSQTMGERAQMLVLPETGVSMGL